MIQKSALLSWTQGVRGHNVSDETPQQAVGFFTPQEVCHPTDVSLATTPDNLFALPCRRGGG